MSPKYAHVKCLYNMYIEMSPKVVVYRLNFFLHMNFPTVYYYHVNRTGMGRSALERT